MKFESKYDIGDKVWFRTYADREGTASFNVNLWGVIVDIKPKAITIQTELGKLMSEIDFTNYHTYVEYTIRVLDEDYKYLSMAPEITIFEDDIFPYNPHMPVGG
jgi:hypothetical protein